MNIYTINPVSSISIEYNTSNNRYGNKFNKLRDKLNESKDKLNEISETEYYSLSTKFDKYIRLKPLLHTKYNMQVVTNAVLKMYEMISQLDIIPKGIQEFNVFCNAELPGGFIVAINHYIKTLRSDVKLNWIASSFISDTGTLSDRYGFYEYNKEKWLMNDIMNGDVTDIKNTLYIESEVHNRFPDSIDLYTSDIGIDVSSDYNSQETTTLPLNYYQIVWGLLTLRKGGTMIVKQFTFFTPFNRSLIYLLTTIFETIRIVKPATSRPLNSEVYIVGTGFKGVEDIRSYILSISDITSDKTLIDLTNIDESNLLQCAENIYNIQISLLDEVDKAFKNKSNPCNTKDNTPINEWIKINKIKKIANNDHILPTIVKKNN